jgi:hypothetical protein
LSNFDQMLAGIFVRIILQRESVTDQTTSQRKETV